MYFSKIEFINPNLAYEDLIKWLNNNHINEYVYHKELWKTFEEDKEASRTFIFRQEDNPQTSFPMFYVVSQNKPINNTDILRISAIKEYNPQIAEAERLSFTIRINPVISKKQQQRKNSIKYDVWRNAIHEGKENGLKNRELNEFAQNETKNWLLQKSEDMGFTLNENEFTVEQNRTIRFKKHPNSKTEIKYGTVEFSGILTVTNIDRFKTTLFEGIGRSKAFGCGLMLIKRAI